MPDSRVENVLHEFALEVAAGRRSPWWHGKTNGIAAGGRFVEMIVAGGKLKRVQVPAGSPSHPPDLNHVAGEKIVVPVIVVVRGVDAAAVVFFGQKVQRDGSVAEIKVFF